MKKWHYYNENDEKACAWIRELIAARLVPDGEVDQRSICDVQPGDLAGFVQCHFFAGILGWPFALKLAGWPENRPVWTGSCPCQPFSDAGKGLGEADPRHLWPYFRNLIGNCRPAVVFGEQVGSKAGRLWLSRVRSDFQNAAYAFGAADLAAASLGSPHKRQRLFWVADSELRRPEQRNASSGMGNSPGSGSAGQNWSSEQEQGPGTRSVHVGGVGNAEEHGREMRLDLHEGLRGEGSSERCVHAFWRDTHWIPTTDPRTGKTVMRRIPLEPSLFPLSERVPGRVGLLRGAGNAIVPQVAAQFIEAFLEVEKDHVAPFGQSQQRA